MQSSRKVWALLALGLTLGLAPGCGSSGPKGTALGPAPRSFPGFPPQTIQESIYATARFDADSTRTFGGLNIVEEFGVLPVEVSFRLRGEDVTGKVVMVEPSLINLRLYLPDGTALVPLNPDTIASELRDKHANIVRKKKLAGGLLNELKDHTGYVFFKLAPKKRFKVNGRKVAHVSGGIERKLDLTRSLLAFNLSIEGTTRSLYVGLQ